MKKLTTRTILGLAVGLVWVSHTHFNIFLLAAAVILLTCIIAD